MKKRKLNIAVTGLNAIDSPGPGIPVIRALREARSFNVRIIGFSYESLEPGIYMHDLVDRTYQVPYPTAGTETLMSRLQYIHKKEKLDIIIPNFDAELYPFIKLEPKLKPMSQRPLDNKTIASLLYETADLIFHNLVLLGYYDIDPEEVYNELRRRFGISGIEEKAAREK